MPRGDHDHGGDHPLRRAPLLLQPPIYSRAKGYSDEAQKQKDANQVTKGMGP
jgi:hypothetical protein